MAVEHFPAQDHGWTPLRQAAITMHEVFVSLTGSGFSENQAIKLIGTMIGIMSGGDATVEFVEDPEDDEED